MTPRRHSFPRAATLFACLLVSAASAGAQTNPPPRLVVNTAGQFAAHAPDAMRASLLCVLGSQIKREWLRRLDLPDKWRDNIVLVFAERPASAATATAPGIWLETVRNELHLQFRIQLRVPPQVERGEVVSALVGALCAEYANRAREFPRKPPFGIATVPVWLSEGLAQSVDGDAERLLPVVRRGVNSGRPLSVEELVGATSLPVEPNERMRFQAHAWVLVESLLSLPKGSEKLCELLREPGAFAEVYRWQFADDDAREKWWSLLLAERATAMVAEDRSAAVTSRQLAAILPGKLEMRLPDAVAEAPVAFAEFYRYTDKEWLVPMAQDKLAQLASLQGAAHPFYRDVIGRYIVALQCLLARQVSRFRHETTLAQRAHAAADEQARKVREYVDQAERVHAPPDRASVWRQLKLFDAAQEEKLLRRDPIGDYLDRFDR